MEIPIDIHTHHRPDNPWEGVVNCDFILRESQPCETYGQLQGWDVSSYPQEGWFSLGIHPWHIDGQTTGEGAWRFDLSPHPHLLAIGEAGLDKLAKAPMEVQIRLFEQQALLAEAWKKPLIIHLVRATDELLAIRRSIRPARPWIIHGFRGKPAQAEQLLKQGLYLSFGERYNEESLRITPIERLFLESDESLVPIRELYKAASVIRRISHEELLESVRENVSRVFFHS